MTTTEKKAETVSEFITRVGLTMTVEPAASNPNASDDKWAKEASHWLCVLSRDGHKLPVPYSCGAAHRRWRTKGAGHIPSLGIEGAVAPFDIRTKYAPVKGIYEKESVDLHNFRLHCTEPTPPDLASVLDCLRMDAQGYDDARDFDDWASNYGYDTESRKAERTYRVCGEQAKALRHFLGKHYDELMQTESL